MNRDWKAQTGLLPCLSVRQPYIEAILAGLKSIELRNWGTSYRGLIVLHAGKNWDMKEELGMAWAMAHAEKTAERLGIDHMRTKYEFGKLVGVARLVKCARFTEEGWERLRGEHRHDGLWQPGVYGWQFMEVRRLDEPVEYRGTLGLFSVPEGLVKMEAKA